MLVPASNQHTHTHTEMGALEFDSSFLQAEEHRPNKSKQQVAVEEGGEIPLIDLSPLFSLEGLAELVEKVGRACAEWGFFLVVNHGIPSDALRRVEVTAAAFFALPTEEKWRVKRNEINPMGYYDTEHTKNVRDWKEVFDMVAQEPTIIPSSYDCDGPNYELQQLWNQWPHYPPEFRETCEEYVKSTEKLAFRLLELISLSLGLPERRLNASFEEQTTFIRLNHYPPCPSPDLALGVGRHKDSGALTILAQDDVGGLQVKRKSDGEWIDVKPVPDSFVVNVGDIIQVWSNDRYESVEHRVVVNSEKERFSIPFFFNPGHNTMVKPLEEMVSEDNPPKYKEYSWGKFFKSRLLSNFKKLDVENIQIYHFEVN